MINDADTAKRYRERAERARTLADAIRDASSRKLHIASAEAYEHMARSLEADSARHGSPENNN